MQNNSNKRNTITRDSLAKAIHRETGLKIKNSAEIVDDVFESLINAISEHKKVSIRMFGRFSSRHKNERIGRNPKSLETSIITARDVVTFKVAPTLKKKINESVNNDNIKTI